LINNELTINIIKNELKSNFQFYPQAISFVKKGIILELQKDATGLTIGHKEELNLTGDKMKAMALVDTNLFPFLFQNLPTIFLFYSRIKNRKIKLYIYLLKGNLRYWEKLEAFLIKYLKDLNVEFEFLNDHEFESITIDNVFLLLNNFSPFLSNLINKKTKKYVKNVSATPFRKIFVARERGISQRIDDDSKIRDFFISSGFEIVYPEQFETFIDQINYFSECRVLAGISGSALANSIFMKPGGAVIELSSFFGAGQYSYPLEFHHFYRIMANTRGLLYFSVSNLSAKAIDILNNQKALDIIKML
jgi:hypothetical protein